MQKILLIDDDVELSQLLKEYLAMEGFDLSAVHDGQQGLEQALNGDAELILLDVMLPSMNGFEVLQALRETSSIPVIMLTARGESVDRVLGLEHGADDYIAKPYHHHELVARIKALFRRIAISSHESSPLPHTDYLQVGDIKLHPASRSVTIDDEELPVTGAEYGVLQCLMEHVGELVDKDRLSKAALGRPLMAYDRSIDMHVSNLRKKLGKQTDNTDRIKTVRSRGYMLVNV